MITKAQLALSAYINNSITEHYEELKKQIDSGALTEDQSISVYAELKLHESTANDIDDANVSSALNFIDNFNIEKIINEKERLRQRAESAEAASQIKDIRIQVNDEKIAELEKQVSDLLDRQKIQEEKDNRAEERKALSSRKKKRIIRMAGALLCLAILGLVWYLLNKYCDEKLISAIIGVISSLAALFAILSFFGIGPKKIVGYFRLQ